GGGPLQQHDVDVRNTQVRESLKLCLSGGSARCLSAAEQHEDRRIADVHACGRIRASQPLPRCGRVQQAREGLADRIVAEAARPPSTGVWPPSVRGWPPSISARHPCPFPLVVASGPAFDAALPDAVPSAPSASSKRSRPRARSGSSSPSPK